VKIFVSNGLVYLPVRFSARKMCLQHNCSRHFLDDGMLTAGCYRHLARDTHDVVGRHGLQGYLQELLESKSCFFCIWIESTLYL